MIEIDGAPGGVPLGIGVGVGVGVGVVVGLGVAIGVDVDVGVGVGVVEGAAVQPTARAAIMIVSMTTPISSLVLFKV
jgi:hypothetical protein